jgi:hypothetical protein
MAYVPNLPKHVSKNPRKILCENQRVLTEGNLRFDFTSFQFHSKSSEDSHGCVFFTLCKNDPALLERLGRRPLILFSGVDVQKRNFTSHSWEYTVNPENSSL